MTFEWDQLLLVGDAIIASEIKNTSSESKNRSAINRYYYAAFKTAYDCCVNTLKVEIPQEMVHDSTIQKYKELGKNLENGKFGEVSTLLSSIKPHRVDADYKINIIKDFDDTAKIVRDSANQILSIIKDIKKQIENGKTK